MINKRRFPVGITILTALVINMIVVVIIRFINGIGAISGLNDGRPWGMWISFDLYCGIALASGGFVLAAIVGIFGREKYRLVYRAALLTAFLGYLLEIFALMPDLGQPWYIWHFFIYWNMASPMFWVALCVMSFTVILFLEFAPAIFEALNESRVPIIGKIKWTIPDSLVRKIQIPLIILGIAISTLHQSSLGSMFLLMHESLHPLWYTSMIPVLFLFTSVAVGPAMVLFETTLSGRVFNHRPDIPVFQGLARLSIWILAVYLVTKFVDIIVAGEAELLFSAGHYSLLWWGETIIGAMLPIVLFLVPSVRSSKTGLFWIAVLIVVGLIFNRFNVSLFALEMRPGYSYIPHWMEISISAGLIAFGMLVIWIAYRYLSMHEDKEIPALD